MRARLSAPTATGGDACGAKLRGRDACARCGHFHERHGGVGEPYASRLRLAHGDGFAMRDHVAQALVVDGCTVDARADGTSVVDQTVAGIAAGSLTVRAGGHLAASGAGSDTGLRFYGVRLLDEGFGAEVASEKLVVDTSWLDASGTDAALPAITDRSWLRTLCARRRGLWRCMSAQNHLPQSAVFFFPRSLAGSCAIQLFFFSFYQADIFCSAFHIAAYFPPFASNSSWVPDSAIPPSPITRIWSAFLTMERV